MNNEQLSSLQKEIYFYNEQTDELLSQLELLTTPRTTRRIEELIKQTGNLNAIRLKMLELGVCDEFWFEADNLAAKTRQFRLDIYSLVPFIIRVENDEQNAKLLQVMAENMYRCCANILQFKLRFGAEMAVQKSQQREVTRSPSSYSALRANSRNGSFQNVQYAQDPYELQEARPAQRQTYPFQPAQQLSQFQQLQPQQPQKSQAQLPQQMYLTRNEYALAPRDFAEERLGGEAAEWREKMEKEVGIIKARLQKLEYVSYAKAQTNEPVQAQYVQKASLANILASATAYDIFMALDAQKKQELLMLLLSEQ